MRINSGPGSLAALDNFAIAGIARSIGDCGAAPTTYASKTLLRICNDNLNASLGLTNASTNNYNVGISERDVALANGADLTLTLVIYGSSLTSRCNYALETDGIGVLSAIHEFDTNQIQVKLSDVAADTPEHGECPVASEDTEDFSINFNNGSGGPVIINCLMRLF